MNVTVLSQSPMKGRIVRDFLECGWVMIVIYIEFFRTLSSIKEIILLIVFETVHI